MTVSLIDEWEGLPKKWRKVALTKKLDGLDGLEKWTRDLVTVHPVLKTLPEEVRTRLAVAPGDWSRLPSNGRMRKRWQRDGLVVHLFAGPDQGFTLERAVKQYGAQDAVDRLLEIDLERGPQHDMLAYDGLYSALVTAALQGRLDAIVRGPNCRTRSVLRHYPFPAGRPRPIRAWGGEEHGLKQLDEDERRMIMEDDVMLWRMIYLYMISNYIKKAREKPTDTVLLIEQPASTWPRWCRSGIPRNGLQSRESST